MSSETNARERRHARRAADRVKQAADEAALEDMRRRRFFAEQFASKYINPGDADYEACVLGEIDRLCEYERVSVSPAARAAYDNALVEYSPHPAWFYNCWTEGEILGLLQDVFVASMSDKRPHSNPRSLRTYSDYSVVAQELCNWARTSPRTFNGLRRVGIDSRLYRAFTWLLGPDSYRYIAPIPIQRLEEYRTASGVRWLVQQLPEECLYCNGDPNQQLVWPRDELEAHLFDVLNYVPGPNEIGHPRPFVSRLVKEAIVNVLQR